MFIACPHNFLLDFALRSGVNKELFDCLGASKKHRTSVTRIFLYDDRLTQDSAMEKTCIFMKSVKNILKYLFYFTYRLQHLYTVVINHQVFLLNQYFFINVGF